MSDEEIARRALDFQAGARSYSLLQIPGYSDWAARKIDQGESPATMAHLDSLSMELLPNEIDTVGADIFEELLEDLKFSLGE